MFAVNFWITCWSTQRVTTALVLGSFSKEQSIIVSVRFPIDLVQANSSWQLYRLHNRFHTSCRNFKLLRWSDLLSNSGFHNLTFKSSRLCNYCVCLATSGFFSNFLFLWHLHQVHTNREPQDNSPVKIAHLSRSRRQVRMGTNIDNNCFGFRLFPMYQSIIVLARFVIDHLHKIFQKEGNTISHLTLDFICKFVPKRVRFWQQQHINSEPCLDFLLASWRSHLISDGRSWIQNAKQLYRYKNFVWPQNDAFCILGPGPGPGPRPRP